MNYLDKAERLVRNHPANKELMELGFGCEIDWGDWGKGIKGRTTQIRPMKWFDHGDDEDDMTPEEFVRNHGKDKQAKILGKPAHLEHYLRLLGFVSSKFEVSVGEDEKKYGETMSYRGINFNLTTGKPATEKDAEEFCNLVSV